MGNVKRLCIGLECRYIECELHGSQVEEVKAKGVAIVWKDYSKTCSDYIPPLDGDEEGWFGNSRSY